MRFINKCSLVVTIQLFLVPLVIAQSRSFLVEVPSTYVSLVFVDDPVCPLKLSGPARVIAYSNGALSFGYALTNTSNANVESFLVKEMDWFGNSSYDHPSSVNAGRVFSPGIKDYTLSDQDMANLHPFDKATASKYGIISRPNRLWVVMVVHVELSDGTVYDVAQKYDQLNDFLNKPFSKAEMSITDLNEREKNLRAFVTNLASSN